MNKEYILCAAIWYKELPTTENINPINVNVGTVICGYRHHNIIQQCYQLTGRRTVENGENSVGKYVQGFLTSKNRFVDRIEGAQIAFNTKQTNKLLRRLYSEDLY